MHDLMVSLRDSLDLFKNMDILIEEYYDGYDIDIEVLIQNNKIKFIAISDNFPPIEPWFVEQGKKKPTTTLRLRGVLC
jgi:hypothetical protein